MDKKKRTEFECKTPPTGTLSHLIHCLRTSPGEISQCMSDTINDTISNNAVLKALTNIRNLGSYTVPRHRLRIAPSRNACRWPLIVNASKHSIMKTKTP